MKTSIKNFSVAIVLVVLGGIFATTVMVRAFADNKPVTITATILETLTLACNNASISNLTAGTPQSAQATCTVTTNGQNGFNLKVHKTTASSTATTTMVHSDNTTWITDALTGYTGLPASALAWTAGTTKGLGFRVRSVAGGTTNTNTNTDWGADETALNAKYAAFPVADQTIYNYASYYAAAATVNIDYKLDVPTTQKSGAYTGTVQYTATTN
ncbi:MAG: hypothetical protein PHW24_04230 [Candidatus Moranbacteria bacterium]|nr:hypothetical protein [Candidatus Moranbacteria bacterium]